MPRALRLVLWVCLAAVATVPAPTQGAEPESLGLSGGFLPDPRIVEVEADGARAADELVRGCPGFVAETEALSVALEEPYTPLRFHLQGDGMAALLLRGPDGIHRCAAADDQGIARIAFERTLGGDFAIWPATAEAGARVAGRLLVSERDLDGHEIVGPEAPSLDALEPARLGLAAIDPAPAEGRQRLAAGPLAGGGTEAAGLVAGCAGYVNASAADLAVELEEPLPALSLYVESQQDTVLLVRDPEGGWHCNDDSHGFNPALTFSPAAAGRYHMLVGSFSMSGGGSATLLAAPGEPRWSAAGDLDRSAPPAAGRHELPEAGLLRLPLTLAGASPASMAGPGCAGTIDPTRPDAIIGVEQVEPTLHLHVTSREDTTLLVVDPEGGVHCDDDTHGLDPAIALRDAPPGDYAIWVGAYSGADGAAATLHLSREAPDWADADLGAGTGWGELNPLLGRDLASAARVLEILMSETGLGEVLSYQRLEENGPEGFTLHAVLLRDPEGANAPVAIERIRVSDLDLRGLSDSGEPQRFSFLAEGMDYSSLAEGLRSEGLAPLPLLDSAPTMSFAASLLPVAGDAEGANATLLLRLDGQLGLHLDALLRRPDGGGPGGAAPYQDVLLEGLGIEIHNLGFLGALLREQAAAEGESVEALVAEGLGELRQLLAPIEAGGPRAQLMEALSAAFADIDRPGALRLRLRAGRPLALETLLEELVGEADGLSVEIDYLPLP